MKHFTAWAGASGSRVVGPQWEECVMPNMPGTVTKTRTFADMDKIWSSDPFLRMKEYDNAPSIAKLLSDAVNAGWISQQAAHRVTLEIAV